jgi:hypothetical protein
VPEKVLETERSKRIGIDVPEELILVRAGRVVTHFPQFKSEKALFANDAKLARVLPSREAETIRMLLPEHGIEVTTLQAPTHGKANGCWTRKEHRTRQEISCEMQNRCLAPMSSCCGFSTALRPRDYRCCVIKPDGSTMDSPKFTTQAEAQRWAAANSNPETDIVLTRYANGAERN